MSHDDNIIQFFSDDTEFEAKQLNELSAWLLAIAKAESCEPAYIEYIFCSDEYLLKINRQFLDHDYYTDIITFPIEEDPLEATIYVSVDRVADNAAQLGVSFSTELHRVMAHGILHLAGYADKTDAEEKLMRKKENEYLSKRPESLK